MSEERHKSGHHEWVVADKKTSPVRISDCRGRLRQGTLEEGGRAEQRVRDPTCFREASEDQE